ncbi:MAG: hypothetical protein JNM88_15455 [Chitinophagaceae bacterium]|nr:hypothetical protein [Chitinophagaceae bacterium]
MQTLNELFSAFKLNKARIKQLGEEARLAAIDCGRHGADKKLSAATWSLLDDLSDKVWDTEKTTTQKITQTFELYELFPSYYHFLKPLYYGIRDKEITAPEEKETIWKRLMHYLAGENYHADPVGYILWVDFFEDESTVRESWQGLLNHPCGKQSLTRLLESSGPVPYDLKEQLYNSLIGDKTTHPHIFNSLLFSSIDLYGKTDKEKANRLLARLKVDTTSENYILLKEKLK